MPATVTELAMDDTTLQEAEEAESPRDLRAELFQGLSTQFAAALESNGSLPGAAQEALIALLDSEAPTASEIVAAASKNDPADGEVGNE